MAELRLEYDHVRFEKNEFGEYSAYAKDGYFLGTVAFEPYLRYHRTGIEFLTDILAFMRQLKDRDTNGED